MALSLSKFFVAGVARNGWIQLNIRCTVCGVAEDTDGRLDDLAQWAEQHQCPPMRVTTAV